MRSSKLVDSCTEISLAVARKYEIRRTGRSVELLLLFGRRITAVVMLTIGSIGCVMNRKQPSKRRSRRRKKMFNQLFVSNYNNNKKLINNNSYFDRYFHYKRQLVKVLLPQQNLIVLLSKATKLLIRF